MIHRKSKKQPESVADFKQRIARIMRERETGRKYSIVGAARPHECVLRPRLSVCTACGNVTDNGCECSK